MGMQLLEGTQGVNLVAKGTAEPGKHKKSFTPKNARI